ncbi:MAG: hypothetical protein MK102_11775 [Fuerstiella sp.]|nr:hypothetical protein [Fuerstiella sp.]
MPGIFEILMLCIIVVAACPMFMRSRIPVSALVPTGLAMFGLGLFVFGLYFTIPNPHESDTMSQQHTLNIDPAMTGLSETMSAADPGQIPVASGGTTYDATDNPSDRATLRVEQTEDGNMLVHPLSAAIVGSLLGTDTAVTLPTMIVHLTARAAMPMTTAGSRETSDVTIAAPSAIERPAWLDNATDNRTVIRSEFEETQEQADAQLTAKLTRALLEEAITATDSESSEFPLEQNSFSMGDSAIAASILDRFSEEVPIPLGTGPKRMFRTAALVEFPADLKYQAVRHVKRSLQTRRTWTAGAAAVSLGFVMMLAAGLLQLAGSPRRVVRWCGIPLITLLILPGVAISSQLVHQMVTNRNTEIPLPFELPVTVIETH